LNESIKRKEGNRKPLLELYSSNCCRQDASTMLRLFGESLSINRIFRQFKSMSNNQIIIIIIIINCRKKNSNFTVWRNAESTVAT
jgi:hypothetical protein